MNQLWPKPHLLVRLALLVSPSEFRRHYSREIYDDAENDPLRAAADAFLAGLGMRFENLWRNVRLAVRSLRKAPLFTLGSVLTIAAAVGLNASMASAIENVLLRPLPYPNSDRLVIVTEALDFGDRTRLSYPDVQDVRAANRTLAAISASRMTGDTLLGMGTPQSLNGRIVDAQYFAILGVRPELGRLFDRSDFPSRNVVISDRLWREYFAASPDALGRSLNVGGRIYRIAGVAPASFRDLDTHGIVRSDYWVPVDTRVRAYVGRGGFNYNAVALLKPGVSLTSARADIRRVIGHIAHAYPKQHSSYRGAGVTLALTNTVQPFRQVLWLFYAAVALVLAIALVNLANLQLVRLTARTQELDVRAWLGGTKRRLAAQFATEAALLAVLGCALGLLLCALTLSVAGALGADAIPRWDTVRVDSGLMLYALAVCALTTTVCGVVPIVLRQEKTVADKSSRQGERNRTANGARVAFVVLQVALAMTLSICGGLIFRSYLALTAQPTGFDARSVYYVNAVDTFFGRSDVQTVQTAQRVRAQISALPGVRFAAVASSVPFTENINSTTYTIPGKTPLDQFIVDNEVSPEYFNLLRIPILRGRPLLTSDTARSQPVAVVSEAFAYEFFGNTNVLGKSIIPGYDPPRRFTIVGVCGNVRGSFSAPPGAEAYFAIPQIPNPSALVIQTNGPTPELTRDVDAILTKFDPDVPPASVVPFASLFAQDAHRAQIAAQIFGLLALVALGLALSGIYAVCAYSVERRTHEFGLRTAIGAKRGSIVGNVLKSTLIQSVLGVAIGTVLAAETTRLLGPMLFQTSPFDPLTFGAVVVLLLVCTSLAAIVPAIRAAEVDPAVALRYE